jgi:hypothetical protein
VSYDLVIFGNLRFARGKFAAWKNQTLDPKGDRSVSRILPKPAAERSVVPQRPCSVAQRIEALSDTTGYGLFVFEEDGKDVTVRCRVSHAAFETRGREIASLFLSAKEVGAEGDICILGEGVFVGYGISLAGGKGELIRLSEEEVQNASMAPELDVISGYFTLDIQSSKPPVIPPDVRKTTLTMTGLVSEQTPRKLP